MMTSETFMKGTIHLTILCLILCASGCATIVRGKQQTVTIVTKPAGQTVEFQGMTLKDGDTFTLQKHMDPAQFLVDKDGSHMLVDAQYEMDPLVIADAALLIFFIVPGLVALGIDFGTGSWRDYTTPQVIYVPVDEASSE